MVVKDVEYVLAMTLPRRLRLDGALSGAVLPAMVEGVAVDIHLPRITAGLGWQRSRPEGFKDLPQLENGLGTWGTAVVVQLHPWRVCSFDVERLGLTVAAPGTELASTWTGRELLLWFERVADWVEVLTGQVNDPRARSTQQPVWGEGLVRWRKDNTRWRAEGANVTADCSVPISDAVWGRPVLGEELVSALERVAEGARPTTRDLLLRDAQVHLLAGDLRRSALDAGLAAELMLARACRTAVEAGAKWPLPRSPLRKATLGPLVKAAQGLGFSLPASFKQGVVDIRNAAAHGGEVTPDEVRTLLDASFDLRVTVAPDWRLDFERSPALAT